MPQTEMLALAVDSDDRSEGAIKSLGVQANVVDAIFTDKK